MLTAGLQILTGCMSGEQARRSILWDVYLTISAAFGVSASMEKNGVANEFAKVRASMASYVTYTLHTEVKCAGHDDEYHSYLHHELEPQACMLSHAVHGLLVCMAAE